MRWHGSLWVACSLAVSGCASLQRHQDGMCPRIAAFANASEDEAVHSVSLTTDWGGRFSKTPKTTLAEKHCLHQGYAPGMRLCDYLMKNTSTEFAILNFQRALKCIDGHSGFIDNPEYAIDKLDMKVSSFSAKGVGPDVDVRMEFSSGSNDTPPVLTILVQRQSPL